MARPTGFSQASWEAEARAEQVFLAVPSRARLEATLRQLMSRPHPAGSEGDWANGRLLEQTLRELGFAVEVPTYEVLLTRPRHLEARLHGAGGVHEIATREVIPAGVPHTPGADALPAFHGYGASGHVRAPVVYAHYATPEDFAELERRGVPVAGAIVLARHGRGHRGGKLAEAGARGARGVLLYGDPADDGAARGPVYPDGTLRPDYAIQRGTVQDPRHGAGDPSTPGWPSLPGAPHLSREQIPGLPTLPSLPIAARDAGAILQGLGGPEAPAAWRGGLAGGYRLGPGPAEVELHVELQDELVPIGNVVATLPGEGAEARSLVLVGICRDHWAFSTSSGAAKTLEVARGIAAARAAGWRPRRTLVLLSWSGEQLGQLGSVEWIEEHRERLRAHAVAYVNLNASLTEPVLRIAGSPLLLPLVREAAQAVDDPGGGSLWDNFQRRRGGDELGWLGGGTDSLGFYAHLGISTLELVFRGPVWGLYHSALDDFHYLARYGDPGFAYHEAAARLYGLLAMRLCAADVLPFRASPLAGCLTRAVDALDLGPSADAASQELRARVAAFSRAALEADRRLDGLEAGVSPETAARLSAGLARLERCFVAEDGLPGRPWFRHLLYAPTLGGQGTSVLPEVAAALARGDGAALGRACVRLAAALDRAARLLDGLASA